jgi:hypothetical protein
MNNAQKQFVIQQHTTPDGVHWDLMLEMEDTLWTWRLTVPPAEIGNEPVTAERIHDHPLRFLTYEGPVQNNTGRVKITDKGTYVILEEMVNSLVVHYEGEVLEGQFRLLQASNNKQWILEKK